MESGPAEEHAGHVFICYASENSDQVTVLERVLRAHGILVWRDVASLWPGQDWKATVRDAIRDGALAILACFSAESLARQFSYQNEELHLAIEEWRQRP